MILTEGFDCPRADCMINAAPTLNHSLYTQKAGRVLRLFPQKENALLIDFGRNERKNKVCTAKTLIGGELPLKIISSNEELELEISDEEEKESVDLLAEAQDYNPLKVKLTPSQANYWESDFEEMLNNPSAWPIEERYISEKQVKFIQKLAKSTQTTVPKKSLLEEMGLSFASRAIEYLLKKKTKKEESEPITEAQENFLSYFGGSIDIGGKEIHSLTKAEASRFIGRYKQDQATHVAWC